MFVYQSRFLTREEVWFDAMPQAARVDWILHHQRSQPLADCRYSEFYTRLVDLQKPEAELFAAFDPKTARRITDAAEKNRLQYQICDARDPRLLGEIEQMWNQFALAQKTPVFERYWVDRFAEAGVLDVVAARTPSGQVMGYHLVLLTPNRARQLFAISPYKAVPDVAFRNAVSRANCVLHWHNFLRFRQQGIRQFDFGGWYSGTTDIRLLGINAFKKSFGGSVVREFECQQPVTLKGRLLLKLAHSFAEWRKARLLQRADSENTDHATDHDPSKISPAFR